MSRQFVSDAITYSPGAWGGEIPAFDVMPVKRDAFPTAPAKRITFVYEDTAEEKTDADLQFRFHNSISCQLAQLSVKPVEYPSRWLTEGERMYLDELGYCVVMRDVTYWRVNGIAANSFIVPEIVCLRVMLEDVLNFLTHSKMEMGESGRRSAVVHILAAYMRAARIYEFSIDPTSYTEEHFFIRVRNAVSMKIETIAIHKMGLEVVVGYRLASALRLMYPAMHEYMRVTNHDYLEVAKRIEAEQP